MERKPKPERKSFENGPEPMIAILKIRAAKEQGCAIPGCGQQYYTQYFTRKKYVKLYNTQYQYYRNSKQLISISSELFSNQSYKVMQSCIVRTESFY